MTSTSSHFIAPSGAASQVRARSSEGDCDSAPQRPMPPGKAIFTDGLKAVAFKMSASQRLLGAYGRAPGWFEPTSQRYLVEPATRDPETHGSSLYGAGQRNLARSDGMPAKEMWRRGLFVVFTELRFANSLTLISCELPARCERQKLPLQVLASFVIAACGVPLCASSHGLDEPCRTETSPSGPPILRSTMTSRSSAPFAGCSSRPYCQPPFGLYASPRCGWSARGRRQPRSAS